jgi:GMP synthase PP-ATPase subunit
MGRTKSESTLYWENNYDLIFHISNLGINATSEGTKLRKDMASLKKPSEVTTDFLEKTSNNFINLLNDINSTKGTITEKERNYIREVKHITQEESYSFLINHINNNDQLKIDLDHFLYRKNYFSNHNELLKHMANLKLTSTTEGTKLREEISLLDAPKKLHDEIKKKILIDIQKNFAAIDNRDYGAHQNSPPSAQ